MSCARLIAVLLLLASVPVAAKSKKDKKIDSKTKDSVTVISPSAALKWTDDAGRLETFPLARYVSAFASGSSADEARSKAAGTVSGIVKSSVQSVTSARWEMSEGQGMDGSAHNARDMKGSATVSSDNELYQLEYTTPFYDEREGCYECVAYIDRVKAFNYVRPRLEKGAKVFDEEYQKAQSVNGTFERVIAIRRSWSALTGFYEVYDFARAVCPAMSARYEATDLLPKSRVQRLTGQRQVCKYP